MDKTNGQRSFRSSCLVLVLSSSSSLLLSRLFCFLVSSTFSSLPLPNIRKLTGGGLESLNLVLVVRAVKAEQVVEPVLDRVVHSVAGQGRETCELIVYMGRKREGEAGEQTETERHGRSEIQA